MKKYILLFMFCCTNCFAQNATLVKDITAGANSSFGDPFTGIVGHIGDKLLFKVANAHIPKLYVTQGTTVTTTLLHAATSSQQVFAYFVKTSDNRIAYTMADLTNSLYKLYVTNGVTIKLMDKHNSSKAIDHLKIYGNYIYYISDHELRRIDLANTMDELVYSETNHLYDFYLESDFNTLYYAKESTGEDSFFVANISGHIKTGLASIGHLLVEDLRFTKVGNRVVFGAFQNPSSNGTRVYSTSGTFAETILLTTILYGEFSPIVYESQLYVESSPDFSGFVTDGTMQLTTDFQGFSVYGFVEFKEELYFIANLSQGSYSGNLLLNRDGTQAGGDQSADGYVYYVSAQEPTSAILNDKLYAVGNYLKTGADDLIQSEIMEINPDPALPVYQRYTFYETKPGVETIYERGLYATDSKLYFIGNEIATGSELYVLNASTPTILSVKSENDQKKLLNFYPNPASDILYLNYTGADPIVSIELRDISGQLVRTYEPSESLDISTVKTGMYFMEVQWRETTSVLKIIKK